MPEGPEIRVMSDFVNHNSKNHKFKKLYHVAKGNNPEDANFNDFELSSDSLGKQIQLNLKSTNENLEISVFMGMTGNWKLTPTEIWNETKYCRMRLDREDGMSLLLYGGYMGPKYRIGGFGTDRGVDIYKEPKKFRRNVIENLGTKQFDKSLPESLLNQKYFNGVGAYLVAEILGRLDYNPFRSFNELSSSELNSLFDITEESLKIAYKLGGAELRDWNSPFGSSKIDEWLEFYGNKKLCVKHPFGKRNIWILKKWVNKT